MLDPISLTLGLAADLALLAALAWAAWTIAARAWPQAGPTTRGMGAIVTLLVGIVALGNLLLAVGGFTLPVTLLVGVVAAIASGRAAFPTLRSDLALVLPVVRRGLRLPWALVTVPFLGVVLLRTLRGTLAPPLAWDTLTYHLYKAGLWVQAGRFVEMAAPGSWRYYLHYPPAGDLLWAWGMLGHRSDTLVPLLSAASWATLPLGAWAVTRAAGASRPGAGLVALGIGGAGAALSLLTSAYIDPLIGGLTLAWLFFLGRTLRQGEGADVLALLGAGLLGATAKVSLLPLFGLGAVAAAWAVVRGARPPRVAALSSVIVALGLVVPWIREAGATGNPFFPFALRVAGHELLRGDPEMMAVLAGKLSPPAGPEAWFGEHLLGWLFVKLDWGEVADMAGLGWAGVALLIAAAVGAVRAARHPVGRIQLVVAVVIGVVFVQALADPGMYAYRTIWTPTVPRLLFPAWLLLVLPAAHLPRRVIVPLALGISLHDTILGLPMGMRMFEAPAVLVAAAALAAFAFVATRSRWSWLALPVLLTGAAAAKDTDRWSRWMGVPDVGLPAYDYHLLLNTLYADPPLWDTLRDAPPLRLAYVPSWTGVGQTNFLFPLLGGRLQHEVIYAPPTRDGASHSLAQPRRFEAAADETAWLRALALTQANALYAGAPDPMELSWVVARPEIFRPRALRRGGPGGLYDIDTKALTVLLATMPATAPAPDRDGG